MSAIQLWWWDLDAPGPGGAAGGAADRAVLSPSERARADRFAVPQAGRRFTAGRARLRRGLGALRGEAPEGLALTAGPTGKPVLAGGPEFNLSHAGGRALFAAGPVALGVDVEALRPLEPGMARLVFTPAERAWLAGQPEEAFFLGWVRKEAAIKARGGSLADVLALEVLPDPALPGWQLCDLAAPPGHAAALAWAGEARAVDLVQPWC